MVKYVKDFEFSSSGPKQVRGYMRGGASCGYAKGGAAKGAPKSLSVMIAVGSGKAPPFAKKDQSPVAAVPVGSKKVGKVMGEFHKGALHSGSKEGPLVKNPKQAMAIALNEARDAKAPVKKQMGGLMSAPGAGAVSDKEMQKLKKVAMPILAKVAKARGATKTVGPSREQFDATMRAREMANARMRDARLMTPAERAQIVGGEGVSPMTGRNISGRPYKKGGSTNC